MRHCQDSSLLPLHLENFFLIHSQTLVICKMLSREWNTLCHAFHWHAASAPCGPTHSTSGRERCYVRNIALDNQHVANSCKIARAANYYCCLLRHTGRSIGAILSPWGYGAGHYERNGPHLDHSLTTVKDPVLLCGTEPALWWRHLALRILWVYRSLNIQYTLLDDHDD